MPKVDLYTKCVLTVIAGALLWLCVRDQPMGTVTYAQPVGDKPQRVIVTGVEIEGTAKTLPVTIRAISRISEKSTWDAIDTREVAR